MNKPVRVSGWQIAFFTLALNFISIALAREFLRPLAPGWEDQALFRTVAFALAAILIVAFPNVRRLAADALRRPIRKEHRVELATVAIANLLLPLAFAGAAAAWEVWRHGGDQLQSSFANMKPPDQELAWAFSRGGLFVVIVGTLVAPVLEELVFRGFLFSAWERRWGWQWSAVLTSATFGIYHPHFGAAFIESVIFICVLRRTGCLAAPIAVHALYNLSLWYPLLGQFMFPHAAKADVLSTWFPQFGALAIALAIVPAYVWLAAKRPADAPDPFRGKNEIPA